MICTLLHLLELAIMSGHRTMSSLRLDSLAIGSDEDARHHAQAAEALGKNVRLDVSVIVFGGPYKSAA